MLVEYDGGPFFGWQRQAVEPTVQSVLEAAAARLAGRAVTAHVAGRTDTGVHATGQVAMLDLPARLDARAVRDALNFHLRPHPVVVVRAAPAAPGWHPRFAATGRAYRYLILNRPVRPALLLGRAWHVAAPLDAAAMTEGARHLVGHHDFTSFRATSCQARTPFRTLERLEVSRTDDVLTVTVGARSFLHHQVRNMVGTLKLVGAGQWRPDHVATVLAARDRRVAGPTAPADGLCLTAVTYATDPFAPEAGSDAGPGAVSAAANASSTAA